jgi:hypothetical protein
MGVFTGTITAAPAGVKLIAATLKTWTDALTALTGATTTYSPTLTNITIGNGTVTAKYWQSGKFVKYSGKISFGTTTTVGGTIGVSVPVNAVDTIGIGSALLYDSSTTPNRSGGECDFSAVGTLEFFGGNGGGPAATALPFTWAVSDQLRWDITYEAA